MVMATNLLGACGHSLNRDKKPKVGDLWLIETGTYQETMSNLFYRVAAKLSPNTRPEIRRGGFGGMCVSD